MEPLQARGDEKEGISSGEHGMLQSIITQFMSGFSVVAILVISALGLAIIFGSSVNWAAIPSSPSLWHSWWLASLD